MHAHTSITYTVMESLQWLGLFSITNWLSTIRPTPLQWLPVLSHCRQTYSLQTSSIISKENLMFLFTTTSSTIQCLVCHPTSKHGPSTRLLPQKTSGELLGRLMIFQLTPEIIDDSPNCSRAWCQPPQARVMHSEPFPLRRWPMCSQSPSDNPLCVCGATLSSLTAA